MYMADHAKVHKESQQQYCISIKSASALRKASFVSTAGSHPAAMTYLNFAQMPYTLHNESTPEGSAVPTKFAPWTGIGVIHGESTGAALSCAPTKRALLRMAGTGCLGTFMLGSPLSNPANDGVLCDCVHPAQTNSLIETPARQEGCRDFKA